MCSKMFFGPGRQSAYLACFIQNIEYAVYFIYSERRRIFTRQLHPLNPSICFTGVLATVLNAVSNYSSHSSAFEAVTDFPFFTSALSRASAIPTRDQKFASTRVSPTAT